MTIAREEAMQKNRMAMRLETGEGVPINKAAARELFREAAEAGLDAAQNNLGYRLYYAQCGFDCDVDQAIEWYKKSAAQGYASAAVNLFRHFKTIDIEVAEEYAKEAKRLGRADANEWLDSRNSTNTDQLPLEISFSQDEYVADRLFREGMMDMHGQNGHAKKPEEAARKFKQAEENGNPYAAFELGQCYRFGRGVGRDLDQALTYLEKAEKKGVTGAAESLKKVKEHLKLVFEEKVSSSSGQNEYQFLESVETILKDSDKESRLKQWRDLTSSYITENITVADGRKAFHIGALALAGCSNLDGRQDVFNALYWFQHSTKSKFVWGDFGQALIDQQSDRKRIAQDLLNELDRPFNIKELLLHKDAFFYHIQEHCVGLDYISSLLILFANAEDDETYGRVESDWRRFLNDASQEHQPDQLDDSERSLLFSGVLFERLRVQNKLDEYDLDDSRRNLDSARSYITRLKQPDDFSASAYSAINACLVEIERSSQDIVRKDVEGRIIALQSHTLKGPLGNALGVLGDIKRWHQREEYDRIYSGLNSMESSLRIIRNLVEANNLILFNQDQFSATWQLDNHDDLLLAQVICEAAQQAILRLNAKEFRLEKTGRKLQRKDVSQAATDISLIDFSDLCQINKVRNGFQTPFQFIKIEFDAVSMRQSVGSDGIKRQFFFAIAHELIFNAIKYDNGYDDIRISLRNDNGQTVLICRNGCMSEEEKSVLHASHRGHDFLKQILAKMTDSYFKINSSPATYEVKAVLGTIWSAK